MIMLPPIVHDGISIMVLTWAVLGLNELKVSFNHTSGSKDVSVGQSTTGWTVMTFCTQIHVPLRMTWNNFGDPLTFHHHVNI